MGGFVSPYSDEIRAWIEEEFPPKSDDCHYLDHVGSALCHASMAKHAAITLAISPIANPHTSQSTTRDVDDARKAVLAFFKAGVEDDYRVVFTSGATAAAKLVADCFGWREGDAFLYLRDAHTSVVGIREVARSKGAKVMCIDDEQQIFSLPGEPPCKLSWKIHEALYFPYMTCRFI
jgi:molybdenum cofactor sulfurtransferase